MRVELYINGSIVRDTTAEHVRFKRTFDPLLY